MSNRDPVLGGDIQHVDGQENDQARQDRKSAPTRKPWETPALEELAVQLSAHRPGRGRDGAGPDSPDCSLT